MLSHWSILLLISVLASSGTEELGSPNGLEWPEWGGPGRDFSVDVALNPDWTTRPPDVLWKRSLGNGHSAISASEGRLYTAFGARGDETVVALDAATGSTLWSASNSVSYQSHRVDYDGPHATPLVSGGRVIVVSIDASVRCYASDDGALLWSRDLVRDHAVQLPQSGYAASPVRWRDSVLLPGLGGSGPGALALSIVTGETLWAVEKFRSSHASPVIVDFGGRPHAVFHGMDWLFGLDPGSGGVLWKHRLRNNAADNVSFTPLWDSVGNQLILSHGYDRAGARGIRLALEAGSFSVSEAWRNPRLKVNFGNGVLIGRTLFASDGYSPSFLVAIDIDSGNLLFKKRGFQKATFLAVRDQLLILEEDGKLSIASTRGQFNVASTLQLPGLTAWVVPTLLGNTLYQRDRSSITAVRLP